MRWPWRRERQTEPELPADDRPAFPATAAREAWRGMAPLDRVVTDAHTTSDAVGFVSTLPTRWRVAPALQPLQHDISVVAPTGRVAVSGAPANGYPEPPELVWPAVLDGVRDDQDVEQQHDQGRSARQVHPAVDQRADPVARPRPVGRSEVPNGPDEGPVPAERPVAGPRRGPAGTRDHDDASATHEVVSPPTAARTEDWRGPDVGAAEHTALYQSLSPLRPRPPMLGPMPVADSAGAAIESEKQISEAVTDSPGAPEASWTESTTQPRPDAAPAIAETSPRRAIVSLTPPLAVARPSLHLPATDASNPVDSSAVDPSTAPPAAPLTEPSPGARAPEGTEGLGVPSWFTGLSVTPPDAGVGARAAARGSVPEPATSVSSAPPTLAPGPLDDPAPGVGDQNLQARRSLDPARPRRVPWPLVTPDDATSGGDLGQADETLSRPAASEQAGRSEVVPSEVSEPDQDPRDTLDDQADQQESHILDSDETATWPTDPTMTEPAVHHVADASAAPTVAPAAEPPAEPTRAVAAEPTLAEPSAEPAADASLRRRVFRVGPPLPPPARSTGPRRTDPLERRTHGLEALAAAAGLPDSALVQALPDASDPWSQVDPAPWADPRERQSLPGADPGGDPFEQAPSRSGSPSAADTERPLVAGPTADEVYEQVRSRIRHELLVDRERSSTLADPT